MNRPAPDADPYLHYLAGLVHGLELRVDGVEAVAGELRARVEALERVIAENDARDFTAIAELATRLADLADDFEELRRV